MTLIQNSTDRRCGKEGCAKRFIHCERLRNCEDGGCGAMTMGFGSLLILCAHAQLPRGNFQEAKETLLEAIN